MSDKAPMTSRGIYLTNLQWADAKAAGNGNYSAGVRLWMEALEAEKVEREATIERYIDANGELVLQVDNLTVELAARACEVIDLELQVEQLEAVPTYRERWFLFLLVFGLTSTLVAFAVALAVLEGIDKAWWGWTL